MENWEIKRKLFCIAIYINALLIKSNYLVKTLNVNIVDIKKM